MKCETTNGYMALKTAELGGSLLKCMVYLSYSLRKRRACASNFNISHVQFFGALGQLNAADCARQHKCQDKRHNSTGPNVPLSQKPPSST